MPYVREYGNPARVLNGENIEELSLAGTDVMATTVSGASVKVAEGADAEAAQKALEMVARNLFKRP